MDINEFESRFNLLKPHIRKAGEKIIQMRGAPDFQVTKKPDDSPVTNADFWSNEYFTELLHKSFPGEIVIGEESEDKKYPEGAEVIWYLDPIDGTKNYVKGTDHFYILIGLTIDGIPTLGMMYKPIIGQFVVGYENSVYTIDKSDNRTTLTADQNFPSDATLIMKRVKQELREALKKEFGIERHRYIRDMIDMLGPLYGESNGYITMRRTAFWDLCTPAAIMKAAGYEIAHNHDHASILFNDGDYETDYFYSFPPSIPEGVKKLLFQYLQ